MINLCKKDRQLGNTCGLSWNGYLQDYSSVCDACEDKRVSFVFRTSCKWAPKVCTEAEDCLNGVCAVIFDDETFENSETCNVNSDCKTFQRCAGHKCLDRRDIYNYLSVKAETDGIGVRI